MAKLIEEPQVNQANLADWQLLILKTTFEAGGFIALGLTNMDNSSAPKIARGSRLEVGGSLYTIANEDEEVTGTPSAGVNYIYCSPQGSTASFSYSSTPAAWNAAKGGWYNGNNRAAAKVFYTDGQYNGKVILDSYNAIREVNTEQSTGGILEVEVDSSNDVNKLFSINLPPGLYRYEIKAGKGGKGGKGNGFNGSAGGNGAEGEPKTGKFVCFNSKTIFYALGGDGNNGGDATTKDDATGGGGGCTGGSAIIDTGDEIIHCMGGSGGGGGYGHNPGHSNGAGGGGGGGYGKGERGGSNSNGEGGHDGIGGAGGVSTNTQGGGGSGFLGGGVGFANGGGYGEPGGRGQNPADGYYGGQSSTGFIDKFSPSGVLEFAQYQGGGQGGGSDDPTTIKTQDPAMSPGGSGLKSSSSGRLRIYRM